MELRSNFVHAGKRYLTDQERREALQHLAPARRYLLRLLLHPGLVAALLALSETWLGGRLLYQLLLKPLSLNSLNVRCSLLQKCCQLQKLVLR